MGQDATPNWNAILQWYARERDADGAARRARANARRMRERRARDGGRD
jgi:hypothetical protein